ncbi:MAG TPA: hypothetical protein DCP05_00780 [Rhodospirillaceae bacterium]|nr:hypothetical protein [Rhodospirillaceae bacterium]
MQSSKRRALFRTCEITPKPQYSSANEGVRTASAGTLPEPLQGRHPERKEPTSAGVGGGG